MPDLETQIAEWRRQMLAAGIEAPAPLDELESHLREEVERQMKSGANPQQAFEDAVNRIGHATALEAEFSKLNGAKAARELKWLRLVCIWSPFVIFSMITYALLKCEMSSLARTLGFTAVAVCCLSIWGALHYQKFLPVISDKRRRAKIGNVICFSLMAWLVGFMNFILPHMELTQDQLAVSMLWLFFVPGWVIIGIACGLEMAARRNISSAPTQGKRQLG